MKKDLKRFLKRKQRTRATIARVSGGKARLSVFRSAQHIYAQVIDDLKGVTIASASTLDKEIIKALGGKASSNVASAEVVGKIVAERAKKANVTEVVFDRGAYLFHGKVKALAEAARTAGLKF